MAARDTDSSATSPLITKAERLARAGQIELAERCFFRALDHGWDPVAQIEYGTFLWRTARYAEAAESFLTLLRDSRFHSDWSLLTVVTCNLAACYRELGDASAAARFQTLAVHCEQRQREAAPTTEAISSELLGQLAADAILAGNYPQAELWLWRSLLQEMATGSDSDQAADWGNLGLVAGLQGDYATGLKHLWEAWRLHHRAGDARGVACDLMHLGLFAAHAGRVRQGERLLERARLLFAQIRLPDLAEQALRALDECRECERSMAAVRWN